MLTLTCSHALYPQSGGRPPARPGQAFEVASVKPCRMDNTAQFVRGGAPGSPGSLHLNCQTLKTLVQRAYLMFRDGRPNPDPFFLCSDHGRACVGRDGEVHD